MKPVTGRVGVVLPQGVLFRGNKEYELRKQMIETDKLECIITLANNLFYGAGISACLLIFRDQKPKDKIGKVTMIDASSIFTSKRAQNELSEADVDQIYKLYSDNVEVGELVKIVTLRDIKKMDYTLSVNRYIERKVEDVKSYDWVKTEFLSAYEAVKQAENRFTKMLRKGGYL